MSNRPIRRRRLTWLTVAVALVLVVTGCSSLGFYTQSVGGQLAILWNRRPVDQILADKREDATLREKLQRVLDARELRQPRAPAPRQRQLSQLRPPRSALRGVERGGGAGALGRADDLVLPGRRLRVVPRLLLALARRALRREAARARLRRRGRGRGGLLDAGLVPRSGALDLRRLAVARPRLAHLPRARAPAALRQGRHRLQRVVRQRDRARGPDPLPASRKATRRRSRAGRRDHDRQRQFAALVLEHRERLRDLYASSIATQEKLRRKTRGVRTTWAAPTRTSRRAGAGTPATTAGSIASSTTPTWRRSAPTIGGCRRSSRCSRTRAAISPRSTTTCARWAEMTPAERRKRLAEITPATPKQTESESDT